MCPTTLKYMNLKTFSPLPFLYLQFGDSSLIQSKIFYFPLYAIVVTSWKGLRIPKVFLRIADVVLVNVSANPTRSNKKNANAINVLSHSFHMIKIKMVIRKSIVHTEILIEIKLILFNACL